MAGQKTSESESNEIVLHLNPVPDFEDFVPGRRHNIVWYCSGGPDAFSNCYATGYADRDEWLLRNVCARHRTLFPLN